MPYSSLAPSFLSYFHPTYFISIMAHLYSLFDLYIPYGNFNFILVLVLKFSGSLNLSFHNLSIHQFSRKNLSLAQFIPRIYNKIIIKILGYFWGVTVFLSLDSNKTVMYIFMSPIYLYVNKFHNYKNFYIYNTKQSQRPTSGGLLLLCWPCCKRNDSDVLFRTYTDETPVLSL